MRAIGSRMRLIEPLIFIILAILPMLFLGTLPIADSQVDLQIDPGGLVHDRLFSWNPNQVGAQSDFGTSYLIIGTFYLALSALLPLWLVERLFFVLIIFTAGYSLFLLAKAFKISVPSAFAAGLFFMYSYWLTIFFQGNSVLVMAYALCPLLLFLTVRGQETRNPRYALLIGLLTCLFAGINPPEAILSLTPSALYLAVCFVIRRDRFVLKFGGIVVIIGLLVNLFWIIPGITSQLSAFGQGVWEESPGMYNQFSSYPEVIRGMGYWGFYEGHNGNPYFAWAPFFLENPLGIILSFIVPVCALLGLMSKRAREPRFLLIAIMMVASIPLAVGAFPLSDPSATGTLYMWIYDNVPLFKAFRSSYKFIILLTLGYALFFGLFLDVFMDKLRSLLERKHWSMAGRTDWVKLAVVIMAATAVMAAYWPAWTGNIQNSSAKFEVPSYYDDVKGYFEDMPDERILLTPGRYYSVYEWGHTALEVMDVVLDNPVVYQNPGDADSNLPGIGLVNTLYTSIYRNDTSAVPLMMRYLGIEYIIQQNDIDYNYYEARSPAQMKKILSSIEGLELVATFGKLDVYRLNSSSDGFRIVETSSQLNLTTIPQGIPIDRLFVNKALLGLNRNIINWTDGVSTYTRPLMGDYEITAEVSISEGEKIGMVLLFGEDDYYTFEMSSTNDNVSGIGHYIDGNLTSFEALPFQGEYDKVQTVTLRSVGGMVDFDVDGQLLGSIEVVGNGTGPKGPVVGFAAIDAVGKMDSIIIRNDTSIMREDFTTNFCPVFKDWEIAGNWAIGNALDQNYSYEGEVPAFIYPSNEAIGRIVDTALVEPEGISYRQVDPARIEIQINGSSAPFVLILKNSYANWKLTIDGEEVPESQHFLVNGYANGWLLNKTGNFSITAAYAPQENFELGVNISIVAFISAIALMTIMLVWPMVHRYYAKIRRE